MDLPFIDPDISVAETPPGRFYRDPELYAESIERIFARSWQVVGDAHDIRVPLQCTPTTLLEGSVDEPLVLTRDADDRVHCLSNVCTHRGTLVCEHGGVLPVLRCRYHGRRFGLDGRFLSMPEFEGVQGFPAERDALRALPVETWGPFVFTSIAPSCSFAEVASDMHRRVGFLPLASATLDPSRSRDYMVQAHWALYCENYLEGLHIPYIHAGLSAALDYGQYRTELFRYANLQLGVASNDDDVFDIPTGWPDHGTRVAAFYFWLFPNTMVNVYPWGISLNIVKPLGVDRTRVSFRSYVWDPSRLDRGAGASLDRVEREDEAVVESVQRGLGARLYSRGRYSVTRETGTHHLHRLMVEHLA